MDLAISLFVFFTLIAYNICKVAKDYAGYPDYLMREARAKRVNILVNGDAKFDKFKKYREVQDKYKCSLYDVDIYMAKEGFAETMYHSTTHIREELEEERMREIMVYLRKAHPELNIRFLEEKPNCFDRYFYTDVEPKSKNKQKESDNWPLITITKSYKEGETQRKEVKP